jgi:hypothetical protein
MPCIFCIAVFMLAAAAITAGTIDQLEERLGKVAASPPKRVTDTGSVAMWNAEVEVGRRTVPIAVTLYKDYGRVRIQVLTHELSREEVEALQDRVAAALGLRIVDRSDPAGEEKVREAEAEHDHATEADAEAVRAPGKEREQVPAPPPPPPSG